VTLRQRLARGYRTLRDQAPLELERLRHQLERLEAELRLADVDPKHLDARRFAPLSVLAGTLRFLARLALFLPLAIPGAIIHYPAYWLIGRLAERAVGGEEDVLATAKIVGAAIFFPITWLVVGIVVGQRWGWAAGVGAGLVSPIAGYAAVRLVERFDRFASVTRAAGLYLLERETFARLATARDRFRTDLVALAERMGL
jgi:hypothetical protein